MADRIAKDGEAKTRALLQRWMDNDPQILGSDIDVLDAIAEGRCDVGLTNTYYLGRELDEDPDFPVAPVFADQDGRGTHVNLSGYGILKTSDDKAEAQKLVEYLAQPKQQQVFADNNFEYPVAPGTKVSDGDRAVRGRSSAIRSTSTVPASTSTTRSSLMQQVGWN